MRIAVTFRNMESSEAIKDYAHQKISKVQRYLDEPIEANVVLSKEKFRERAEVTLVANRRTINSAEETTDIYEAIDKCSDKLERQVQKFRKKRVQNKKNSPDMGSFAQSLNPETGEEE
jgi:putative sigma-54 modulation protein